MVISIVFFNCNGKRKKNNQAGIVSTLQKAVGEKPHIVGLCEVWDQEEVPRLVTDLTKVTKKRYYSLFSRVIPGAPRLGLLVDMDLGKLSSIGNDDDFRHGKDWRNWLAGRVDFLNPKGGAPLNRQLSVIVNHWTSMKAGRLDTIANREILAWEIGNWMCKSDPKAPQVINGEKGSLLPVIRQASIVMGDFNCEPGSLELRSRRKFTLQAMRDEPSQWKNKIWSKETRAILYDLSWRMFAGSPGAKMPGTYNYSKLHGPEMLDRMLVSRTLWNGPGFQVQLMGNNQAMSIFPVEDNCSDHCAIGISVKVK